MDNERPSWTPQQLKSPHTVDDKSVRVRRMFDAIAPTYELINSLFSARRDAAWRETAVRLASVNPDDDVLDIACGTGDFARAFQRRGVRHVTGCDFSHHMLQLASGNTRHVDQTHRPVQWCEADAQHLPFRSASFSVASCAFGVRNFQDLDLGLREMNRVLRPGGRAVIVEFTQPRSRIVRSVTGLYTDKLMPGIATWISGDRTGAYRYLPRSVVSFLTAEQLCQRLRQAGFVETIAKPMTLGIVTIYIARSGT